MPLLLGSVTVNYLGGAVHRAGRVGGWRLRRSSPSISACSAITNISASSRRWAAKALPWAPWDVTALALVLPLGISFYTFHQIGYQIDRFRGQARKHNFIDYTLFVTFFPQLIAGPIVRRYGCLPQLQNFAKRIDTRNLLIGLTIFSIGLFKKVIFADTFALYATPVFDTAAKGVVLDGETAWLGVLAYAFQIYFDFSGYSDMAIGLARMIGIELPINFKAPYRSRASPISGGDGTSRCRACCATICTFRSAATVSSLSHQFANLMVVMLLCGLWHGAAWAFIVWGGLHGLALAAHRLWLRLFPHESPRGQLWRAGAWALTFAFVGVTWVFFRADSLQTSAAMLQSMFSPASFSMTTEIEGLGGESGLAEEFGFGWAAILFAILWVLIAPTTQELMRRAMRAAMYRPFIERASLHLRPSSGSLRPSGWWARRPFSPRLFSAYRG